MSDMDRTAVIVGAARLPTGRFLGGLSSLTAPELGARAIAGVVERSSVATEDIEEVIMGNVVQAGVGQAPARQAAIGASLPATIPAMTINKVCGSGLKAVMLAAQAIRAGDLQVAVAGGMESMSNVPYLVRGYRGGVKFGDQAMVDGLIHDGLWCSFGHCHMGGHAEYTAWKIVSRKGTTVFDTDEPPRRDTTVEALGRLRPAFSGDAPPEVTEYSVTAGNAPGLNDGAAATVVTSEAYARANGLDILGRVAAYSVGSTEPRDLFFAPVEAVRRLMDMEGTEIGDYGLIEANEAFAVQSIADARQLGMDMDRVNVRGGAIAIGHPIGASGARILTTLLYAMRDREVDKGLATLCLGGGNAVALSVERV